MFQQDSDVRGIKYGDIHHQYSSFSYSNDERMFWTKRHDFKIFMFSIRWKNINSPGHSFPRKSNDNQNDHLKKRNSHDYYNPKILQYCMNTAEDREFEPTSNTIKRYNGCHLNTKLKDLYHYRSLNVA